MDHITDVEFDNVRYCYGEVCAVNSVNFSLVSKKLTVFIGPNGGGKSTLIKLLSGLLKPEEGAIVCRKGLEVGYVPQNSSFDTSFPITVGDMVLQGTLTKEIRLFCKYSTGQREKAADVIRRVGLSGFEHRSVSQLSGGQLKRAVIARALASDADMIVLDEPDASLDVDAAKELYGVLALLKNEKSIIIASHHIDAVLDIADRVIYVNKTATEYPSPQELKGVLKGGITL